MGEENIENQLKYILKYQTVNQYYLRRIHIFKTRLVRSLRKKQEDTFLRRSDTEVRENIPGK